MFEDKTNKYCTVCNTMLEGKASKYCKPCYILIQKIGKWALSKKENKYIHTGFKEGTISAQEYIKLYNNRKLKPEIKKKDQINVDENRCEFLKTAFSTKISKSSFLKLCKKNYGYSLNLSPPSKYGVSIPTHYKLCKNCKIGENNISNDEIPIFPCQDNLIITD